MELLNHVAKHHVNEKDEVNLIKDRGGEAGKKEINQEKANENPTWEENCLPSHASSKQNPKE